MTSCISTAKYFPFKIIRGSGSEVCTGLFPSHRHDNFSPHASLQELQSVGRFLYDYSALLCKYKTKDQINISFTGGEPTVNPKFIE